MNELIQGQLCMGMVQGVWQHVGFVKNVYYIVTRITLSEFTWRLLCSFFEVWRPDYHCTWIQPSPRIPSRLWHSESNHKVTCKILEVTIWSWSCFYVKNLKRLHPPAPKISWPLWLIWIPTVLCFFSFQNCHNMGYLLKLGNWSKSIVFLQIYL
jgi:hypothetical protein